MLVVMTVSAMLVLGGAMMFFRGWHVLKCTVLVTVTGMIGLMVGLLAQAPFYPPTLTGTDPVVYLGTAMIVALLSGSGAGWAFTRTRRGR